MYIYMYHYTYVCIYLHIYIYTCMLQVVGLKTLTAYVPPGFRRWFPPRLEDAVGNTRALTIRIGLGAQYTMIILRNPQSSIGNY